MQLEFLKVFCDVARRHNFSEAAIENNISQSAVSQIVHQLERRLGVQLIDRAARGRPLTPLGQVFYDGCNGLFEHYQELEATIRNARDLLAMTVQVAAIYSVGLGDMGQYVERFVAQQPSVQIHIDYLHPDRVYEKVLDGTADFGLVSFPRKLRELKILPWREEEMVLVCSPDHPFSKLPTIKPAQLAGERYIGFTKELVIRRKIDRFLNDQGATVEVALEFDNIENIKKAVEVCAGVALLPEPTLRREVQRGVLAAIALQGCRLVRPLGIIQRRHHRLSSTALRFIELLRQPLQLSTSNEAEAASFATGPVPQQRSNGSHRARGGTSRASRRTG